MKRLILIAALLASACTTQGRNGHSGPPLKPVANPGAVIAADLAFNQLAQSKGQWTAFRESAAPLAEMFVPERVLAADWLKGRTDPPTAVKWQPHAVWSSCDGSHAVSRGNWQRPGSDGTYVTVWQRQKGGAYKWLVDLSITTERAAAAPEMIAARVADCKAGAGPAPLLPPLPGTDAKLGMSADKTLQWSTEVDSLGGRQVMIFSWNGASFDEVFRASIPPSVR